MGLTPDGEDRCSSKNHQNKCKTIITIILTKERRKVSKYEHMTRKLTSLPWEVKFALS